MLNQLGRTTISKLIGNLEEDVFKKGDYIVREGEYGETFYIIIEGEVDVTDGGRNNQAETFIRTIGKGEHFGEKALLNESGMRSANVIAKSDKVRCMTLEKKDFLLHIGDKADIDRMAAAPVENRLPVGRESRGNEKKPGKSVIYQNKSSSSLHPHNANNYQKISVARMAKKSGHIASGRRSIDMLMTKESRKSTIIAMPKRRMHSVFENITLRDFEFIGILGVGGFGRVELVTLKNKPNQSFALKCMKKVSK